MNKILSICMLITIIMCVLSDSHEKKGYVDSVGTGTVDQNPHGSALIWLSWSWTQIRTRNADQNTKPGARKLTTKSD